MGTKKTPRAERPARGPDKILSVVDEAQLLAPAPQVYGLMQTVARDQLERAYDGQAMVQTIIKALGDRLARKIHDDGFQQPHTLDVAFRYKQWDPEDVWYDDQGAEHQGQFVTCEADDPNWEHLVISVEGTVR